MHECVIINLCKEYEDYSCKQSGGGAAQDEGVLHMGVRDQKAMWTPLKTALDIMQDDSSHRPHTRLLPS